MVDSFFRRFGGENFSFLNLLASQSVLQLACGGVGIWWYFTYGPGALMAGAASGGGGNANSGKN